MTQQPASLNGSCSARSQRFRGHNSGLASDANKVCLAHLLPHPVSLSLAKSELSSVRFWQTTAPQGSGPPGTFPAVEMARLSQVSSSLLFTVKLDCLKVNKTQLEEITCDDRRSNLTRIVAFRD